MLVFVKGGKPLYDVGSGEQIQVTLVGASAISPFQLPLCHYNRGVPVFLVLVHADAIMGP